MNPMCSHPHPVAYFFFLFLEGGTDIYYSTYAIIYFFNSTEYEYDDSSILYDVCSIDINVIMMDSFY